MTDLLAVYGTLLAGLEPPAAPPKDGRLEWVGPCRIPGTLFDCGPYPALVATPSAAGVAGELYRIVSDAALRELDAYEGFDPATPARSLFVRVRVRLSAPDVEAWVYVGGTARGRVPIPGGDWRAHVG